MLFKDVELRCFAVKTCDGDTGCWLTLRRKKMSGDVGVLLENDSYVCGIRISSVRPGCDVHRSDLDGVACHGGLNDAAHDVGDGFFQNCVAHDFGNVYLRHGFFHNCVVRDVQNALNPFHDENANVDDFRYS